MRAAIQIFLLLLILGLMVISIMPYNIFGSYCHITLNAAKPVYKGETTGRGKIMFCLEPNRKYQLFVVEKPE